jgi:hypothetical protein
MSSFRIGGSDSEFLSVNITGRSRAGSSDYWDGNWLNAVIEIDAGGFRGLYGAYLRAEELREFREGLARLYSFDIKETKFETMEGQLDINVRGDGLGHFTAECVAVDQAGTGNRLSFTLSFDQTDIPAILRGLDSLVEEFPVRGA